MPAKKKSPGPNELPSTDIKAPDIPPTSPNPTGPSHFFANLMRPTSNASPEKLEGSNNSQDSFSSPEGSDSNRKLPTSPSPFTSNRIDPQLLSEALGLEVPVIEKPVKTISKETLKKITDEIGKVYRCSPPLALVGLLSTLQAGGTNKNKRSNVKITIATTAFESKIINKAIETHCKDHTPRQFATYFRDEIQAISQRHNITGNAFISLRRNYLTNTLEHPDDKYWASDFQLDNPKCPPHIHAALMARYNDKFVKKI
jgi:hypothetical protein